MEFAYQDQYIDVPDVLGETITARYWETGTEHKQVMLFLHGIGDSLEMCLPTIDYFRDKFHFIAVDLPGHGKSSLARNKQVYSTKGYTTYLWHFVQALNLTTPLVIFAHSLGGILATRYTLHHQETVSHLVMVSPGGFNPAVVLKFRIGSLPVIGRLAFTRPMINMMRDSAQKKHPANEYYSRELIDLKYDYQLNHSKDAIRTLLQNEVRFNKGFINAFTADELQRIHVPSLIFWGLEDSTVPAIQHIDALAGLQNCRIVLFKGAQHRAMISRADTVFSMATQFLETGKLNDEIERQQPYYLP